MRAARTGLALVPPPCLGSGGNCTVPTTCRRLRSTILDRLPAGIADVKRCAVGGHRHQVGQLAHWDRAKELPLTNVEDLNAVVAGIGDVQHAARFIEHQVPQSFIALAVGIRLVWSRRVVGCGRHRVDDAALVWLTVIHVHADVVVGC